MLDIKFIRENVDAVKTMLKNRNYKLDLDRLLSLDSERRKLVSEVDTLKSQKNKASDEIGKLMAQKVNAKEKIDAMKAISQNIDILDKKVEALNQDISKIMYDIPNMPHSSVPIGPENSSNKVIKEWGKHREFDFKPKNHIEIAESLGIVDFSRATKITASSFILFKGKGAKLERALINFMLDLHTKEHGYTEIFPPFLVNRNSMTGTGQLPKFEEDMYGLKNDDLFLVPTAEVPLTNIFRDEVLDGDKLPIYYTAYTACFRREAGSYGKDTRGLIRVHQFDKVELVKFVKPETSYDEHEKLLNNAEKVLQLLNLPYRIVLLSTQGISFAASKCYDIELWAPGSEMNLEVSSCSNFEDFQARRANIRYRSQTENSASVSGKRKPQIAFVHTLNASGVALPRLVVAILENYQKADGTVVIPEVLRKYFDGASEISPENA